MSTAGAMEAMLENENALMDFFTAAPLGLMWIRPDGSVERVNQAQLTLLDRSGEEVVAPGEEVAHLLLGQGEDLGAVEPDLAADDLGRRDVQQAHDREGGAAAAPRRAY